MYIYIYIYIYTYTYIYIYTAPEAAAGDIGLGGPASLAQT